MIVRLTSSPINEPEKVAAGFVIAWQGLDVPLEDAARYATAVAWNEEREIFEPFVATQRFTQFEWGASGSTLEFAVEMLAT